MILLAWLTGFVLAWVLSAYLARPDARLRWMDHPNARSLHERPVPRTGGLAILAGILVGGLAAVLLLGPPALSPWVGVALLLVIGAALWDDVRGLGVVPRLSVQFLAAGLAAGTGLLPGIVSLPGFDWGWPGWAAPVLGVLFLVWMTNLYNFMDGMDGFAGGMTVIGFGFMAWLGWRAGTPLFSGLALCVALSAAGFLRWNLPPARIFMGDTGASALGFLAAVFILWAERDGVFPLWAGLLIFSPFIVDATVTVLRRALAGEAVWRAHRSHHYQRLVVLGWGHGRTTLAGYVLMLLAGGSALVMIEAQSTPLQVTGFTIWLFVYAIIAALIRRLELRQ